MVKCSHSTHLKRSGRIQNVKRQADAAYAELALVHLLDGALVLGAELSVQELRDDGRLADARRAHHDDLVVHIAGGRRRGGVIGIVPMYSGRQERDKESYKRKLTNTFAAALQRNMIHLHSSAFRNIFWPDKCDLLERFGNTLHINIACLCCLQSGIRKTFESFAFKLIRSRALGVDIRFSGPTYTYKKPFDETQ